MIPIYSWLCITVGIVCLALGLFVFLKNKKSQINVIYFLFCLGIFMWLIPMSLLSSKIFNDDLNLFFGKLVFTSVVFLPSLALNFADTYLSSASLKTCPRGYLKLSYITSLIFLCLLWLSDSFLIGTYHYSWGNFPKGGIAHIYNSIFLLIDGVYAVVLLGRGLSEFRMRAGKTKKYYEIKYIFLAFSFVIMASTDLLQNRGIDFFPIGAALISFFIFSIAYAIFKHEWLGITLVLRRGLTYSLIISLITSLYFLLIYLLSVFIGQFINIRSLPLILALVTITTIIFKPLEQKAQNLIDHIFGIKPREDIERENLLLLEETIKHDKLKAVSVLAAGMAHEIKNPLVTIKTFAEHLPKKYNDPDFRDKFSRLVSDEVDRINNIVKQLLEFSKPQPPIFKKITIGEILQETLSLLNNNLIKNKIELSIEIDRSHLIRGDRNQLKQVFLNLVLNSIQAMPNGGQLTVKSARFSTNELLITIKDQGEGVLKEDLSRVFEPFFTRKDDGTGLGLSIAHSIIDAHGGKIWLESEVGKGAEVYIKLKLTD